MGLQQNSVLGFFCPASQLLISLMSLPMQIIPLEAATVTQYPVRSQTTYTSIQIVVAGPAVISAGALPQLRAMPRRKRTWMLQSLHPHPTTPTMLPLLATRILAQPTLRNRSRQTAEEYQLSQTSPQEESALTAARLSAATWNPALRPFGMPSQQTR